VRFVWYVGDPIGAIGAFRNYGVQRFFLTGTVPWGLSTSVAIAFYWWEIIRRMKAWKKEAGFANRKRVQEFLPTLKWIFLSLAGALIVLDLICTILLSQFSDIESLVIIPFAILGILELGVAIFFVLAGARVLAVLHKFQNKSKRIKWWQYFNTNNPSQIQLMSIRIMISGLGMMITGVFSLVATSNVLNDPPSYVAIFFLMHLGMLITSVTHVLAVLAQGSGVGTSSEDRSGTSKPLSDKEKQIQIHESASAVGGEEEPEEESDIQLTEKQEEGQTVEVSLKVNE